MSIFALIHNGTVAQIDAATFPVAASLVWTPDVSAVSPAPQVGWIASETGGAWTFTAPPAPPASTLAQQAVPLLADTDRTVIRVAEGVAMGTTTFTAADVVAFMTYRRALRAIIDGTSSPANLPTKPAYPAGT